MQKYCYQNSKYLMPTHSLAVERAHVELAENGLLQKCHLYVVVVVVEVVVVVCCCCCGGGSVAVV